MDQTFDRLQKLISQLEIQGEVITQEDMNLKLLRSLPSEWKTHALIWRNKEEIETISLDDLYNNLKIYEPELTGSSSLSQNPQNVVFVSSNSTNKEMDLQWEMAMLNQFELRRFIQRAGRKLDVNGQRVGFDRTKVECYNLETPTKNALVAQDRIGGYDWSSPKVNERASINFALMTHTSSEVLPVQILTVDSCLYIMLKAVMATLKEQ
ncbi:hypothetical protein Tco_1234867 [Tanacetum coccineum]